MIDRPASFPGSPQFGGQLPVGAVTAYAGWTTSPEGSPPAPLEAQGWMICDGRSLPIQQYPQLYAALGLLYGGDDGTFNLPDYRGTFLRGVDAGRGMDPDAAIRTPASQGQSGGVGSTQACALQVHGHEYAAPATAEAPGAAPGGPPFSGPPLPGMMTSGPVGEPGTPAVNTSLTETRPANIAVTYIIRFA
ncbi:phage tail protein [Sphingomonas sp. ZT3P38]|uniref:phage tail protein n=1 Tax=Parasphingomonas zepuensis TaxID=3096161 RepID=UPI002FC91BBD